MDETPPAATPPPSPEPVAETQVATPAPVAPDPSPPPVEEPTPPPPPPETPSEPAAPAPEPEISTPPAPETPPPPTPEPAQEPPKPPEEAPVAVPSPPTPTTDLPPAILALTDEELKIAATLYLKKHQQLATSKASEVRKAKTQKNIGRAFDFVTQHAPTTVAEVARALSFTPNQTAHYLQHLVKQGKVRSEGGTKRRRYLA